MVANMKWQIKKKKNNDDNDKNGIDNNIRSHS